MKLRIMKELKKIKKHYGEKAMHFCRDNFGLLLDQEGLLLSLIDKSIFSKKDFFHDLFTENKQNEFKAFLYKNADNYNNISEEDYIKSAQELLNSVGYEFYHCTSVEDVKQFQKYYRDDESLCTFNSIQNRLNTCYIFWIVRKELLEDINALDGKREMKRQDEYGTSCCSIQISKQGGYVSIKNRYNHKVSNCDATFSNNLENIIEGLTLALQTEFNIKFKNNKNNFELNNYINVNDKFYKYSVEVDGRHFGVDWYQDENFNVIEIDTNTQMIFDHFLLDFKEKSLFNILKNNTDLDIIFDKVIMYTNYEEYQQEEDESGILKLYIEK